MSGGGQGKSRGTDCLRRVITKEIGSSVKEQGQLMTKHRLTKADNNNINDTHEKDSRYKRN